MQKKMQWVFTFTFSSKDWKKEIYIYSFPNYISIEILILLNLTKQYCNLSVAVVSMHFTLSCLFLFPVIRNCIQNYIFITIIDLG